MNQTVRYSGMALAIAATLLLAACKTTDESTPAPAAAVPMEAPPADVNDMTPTEDTTTPPPDDTMPPADASVPDAAAQDGAGQDGASSSGTP